MTSALFIRSYWKDLDWLALCLQAIERRCRGFSELVVAVPESSRAWVQRRRWHGVVRFVYGPTYADDYLGQQVTKLHADRIVDADLIVHVDADCIFKRPTRPQQLAPGGRPRLATRPITELGRHYPWRAPTEAFLGFPVELDFMQQPPFVYPRWIYPELRRHCERRHGVPLEQYVVSRPTRGFSEFNALGAYAWQYHRDDFEFLPAGTPDAPPEHCDWHWSWGGITDPVRQQIEFALAGDEVS